MAPANSSSTFRIDRMLGAAPQPATKTAAATTQPAAAPRSALSEALDAAAANEKTASEAAAQQPGGELSPVAALEKIAAETIENQTALREKQAKMFARVFADEVVMHLGGYNKLAQDVTATSGVGASYEKIASEHPELLKQAAESGYVYANAHIEKLAAEAYNNGIETAYKLAHESATNEYIKAAVVTNRLLQQSANSRR